MKWIMVRSSRIRVYNMIMGYDSKDLVTYPGFSYSLVMKGLDPLGYSCQILENAEE